MDPRARCSFPQLKAGGVKLQVTALFTETEKNSEKICEQQIQILEQLPKHYPNEATLFNGTLSEKISLLAAVENASGLCGEEEPLETGLKRLDALLRRLPCLYISLTWNGENRFGGGAGSTAGLKEDGKCFLKAMSGKVALDLSHSSDRLAFEALNFIDKEALQIPILASHSNFRARCGHLRNLPDEIAREIICRKGVIGLVFYKKFLQPATIQGLLEQIEHGLQLGGEKTIAFGSDFFCTEDFPQFAHGFIDGLGNASQYPQFFRILEERGLNPQLFSENALRFIQHFFLSLSQVRA